MLCSWFPNERTQLQRTGNTSLTIPVATMTRVSPWLIEQSNGREQPTDPPVRCLFPASPTPPTYQDQCTGGMGLHRLVRIPTVPPANTALIIMSGVLCRTICLVPLHRSCLQARHFSAIDECVIVYGDIVCRQCLFHMYVLFLCHLFCLCSGQ